MVLSVAALVVAAAALVQFDADSVLWCGLQVPICQRQHFSLEELN